MGCHFHGAKSEVGQKNILLKQKIVFFQNLNTMEHPNGFKTLKVNLEQVLGFSEKISIFNNFLSFLGAIRVVQSVWPPWPEIFRKVRGVKNMWCKISAKPFRKRSRNRKIKGGQTDWITLLVGYFHRARFKISQNKVLLKRKKHDYSLQKYLILDFALWKWAPRKDKTC